MDYVDHLEKLASFPSMFFVNLLCLAALIHKPNLMTITTGEKNTLLSVVGKSPKVPSQLNKL